MQLKPNINKELILSSLTETDKKRLVDFFALLLEFEIETKKSETMAIRNNLKTIKETSKGACS